MQKIIIEFRYEKVLVTRSCVFAFWKMMLLQAYETTIYFLSDGMERGIDGQVNAKR